MNTIIHASILLFAIGGVGQADEPTDKNSTEAKREQAQAERLRAEALRRAKDIRVVAEDGSPITLIEQPVLRFGEPTRGNEDGSLWVWGKKGRPLVMAELYRNAGNKVRWVHAITQTSTELVVAETESGRWAPRQSQLDLTAILDAPAAAKQKTARLGQLKTLARRFKAHEFWKPDNTRYELRLLIRPLRRYEDAATGLLDGAVFVFANGTNPEILMFVEAHAGDDGASKWLIGFAPLGSAELHVTRNDEDVWKQPRAPGVVGRPSDPYWIFSVFGERAAE